MPNITPTKPKSVRVETDVLSKVQTRIKRDAKKLRAKRIRPNFNSVNNELLRGYGEGRYDV